MSRFGAPERIPDPAPGAPAPGSPARPLNELEGWLRRNRTAAIVGAGGLVAGLALLARRGGASAGDASGTADGYTPAGYTAGGSGTYDSTSSDLYNSLQPQLEALGARIDALDNPQLPTPAPTPTPKPPAPKPPSRTPLPVKKPPPIARPRVYVVQRGDTLSAIAKRFYGNAARFTDIARVNKIPNPNRIRVGQRLTLP